MRIPIVGAGIGGLTATLQQILYEALLDSVADRQARSGQPNPAT